MHRPVRWSDDGFKRGGILADCVCLSGCLFFNDRMAEIPVTAALLKKRFCLDQFKQCARCQVFSKLGRERVPTDLYPSQSERVAGILAGA